MYRVDWFLFEDRGIVVESDLVFLDDKKNRCSEFFTAKIGFLIFRDINLRAFVVRGLNGYATLPTPFFIR